MITVKLKNGKVKLVSNNIAHGMIERGEAVLCLTKVETKEKVSPFDKAMRPSKKKRYKTK